MALSKKAQAIQKAYEELKYLSQDERARQEFEDYQMAVMDEMVMKKHAMAEGIVQGIEKGKKEGIKEGEKNRNIEIAKKMLEENMDIAFIVKITGLTKEEVEKLK